MGYPKGNDGRDLEKAVENIERLILEATGQEPSQISIEPRKVIITQGVTDEIDLYVKIDSAPGYSAVFLFECKDWSKPVGKGHIDGLRAKMHRLGAQTAFFVAPKFTADAYASAAQSPKVILREAEKSTVAEWAHLSFSFFKPVDWTYDLRFSAVAAESPIGTTPRDRVGDLPSALWLMNLPVRRAAREVLREACKGELRERFGSAIPPGEHLCDLWQTRLFEPAEFRAAEVAVRGLTVKGSARLTLIDPTKVVAFEVEGRGRTIEYTWKTLEGDAVQGRISQTDQA